MRMILNRRAVLPMIAAIGVTACGGGTSSGTDERDILATTSIWADITSATLCGEAVTAIIPAGADAHAYEPSLRDRQAIEGTRLVVSNGAGLEGALAELIETADADDATVVEMTTHVDVITPDEHDDHDSEAHDDHEHEDHDADHEHEDHDGEEHDHDHGHGHGEGADPHIWQDPRRIANALDVIASAATPLGFDDCSRGYRAELLALDAELDALFEPIPISERLLVTSHDSLAYFADRYEFEVVGTVIPATSTLASTSAGQLADLADIIEARGIRAIFTEELESSADANALAERLGVAVVPLITDALGDSPDTDTYIEMLRSNATKIAEALAP